MSDIFAPQPVKTKTAGDVASKIVDATTPAQGLAVDSGGNASVNVGKVGGSAVATGAAGVQKVAVTDGTGTAITSTSSALDVNIKSGGTSGVVAQASTTSGESGMLVQGAVTTSAPSYTTAQTNPLSLTTAGALRTDASATTQPVSGTVTVQQSTASNLKVDLSGTAANATAIKVDNSGVTQPVSGTVTVQQSTASSLKVDLSGTAANATAIKVDGSAVTQPVSFGLSGTVTDDYLTSAALAAGATVTLDSTQIASGTGHLVEATITSSVALKAQLGTWDGTTFTVKRTFFVPANAALVYTPSRYDEITKATGATAKFRWSITNNDNANAADVYASTTYWN